MWTGRSRAVRNCSQRVEERCKVRNQIAQGGADGGGAWMGSLGVAVMSNSPGAFRDSRSFSQLQVVQSPIAQMPKHACSMLTA